VPDKRILFITSLLSRRIIALAKRMQRDGYGIYVAAPANENLQYLPQNQFVRLRKFFGRLSGQSRVKNFNGRIICFDKGAEKFAKNLGQHAVSFFDDIGIDLSVWSPKATSGTGRRC